MKKVIYIIAYKYLSLPLYRCIAETLKDDYENYLLYFEEPFINQEISYYPIENSLFREFRIFIPDEIKRVKEIIKNNQIQKNIHIFVKDLVNYKFNLEKEIKKLEPDIIITTTDSSFISRIIANYSNKNNIPLLLFQPSFIDPIPFNLLKIIRDKFYYLIFNIILRIPIFNWQPYWGNEAKNAYVFIWIKDFPNSYNNK